MPHAARIFVSAVVRAFLACLSVHALDFQWCREHSPGIMFHSIVRSSTGVKPDADTTTLLETSAERRAQRPSFAVKLYICRGTKPLNLVRRTLAETLYGTAAKPVFSGMLV